MGLHDLIKHLPPEALTVDSWLGRALANMPAPTGKPLDGWQRFEPQMKGFRYRQQLENGKLLTVYGGPRKGWEWMVYPPSTGQPRHPVSIGHASHLDYAMMGAEQYETFPKVVTLSALEPVQYIQRAWDFEYSGSLTKGTARIIATHIPARQSFAMGVLDHPGPGVLAYGAWYIPEMSMFYPVKDHGLIHELGKEAIWAYLHQSGAIDDDGQLCVFPNDDPDEDNTAPPPLLQ